jgi:hypothetical protein
MQQALEQFYGSLKRKLGLLQRAKRVDSFDPTDRKEIDELERHRQCPFKSRVRARAYDNAMIDPTSLELVSTRFFKANLDQPILVRFDCLRTYYGKTFTSQENPFTRTAIELIKDSTIEIPETFLFKFCNDFQPKSYGDIFGVSKGEVLGKLSPYSEFLPWIHEVPRLDKRPGVFGPKHETYVEHTVIRLRNLLSLIEKYSYIPSFGDMPMGYVLQSEKSWRFILTAGHHRMAVLGALKEAGVFPSDKIAVRGASGRFWSHEKVVFKDSEAERWPGVKSGTISEIEAIELFHRFFF